MIKVLIIETNVIVRKLLADAVNMTGVAEVAHASPNGELANMWLEQNKVDIILLAADIEDRESKDILKNILNQLNTKVIIMYNSCKEPFKMNFENKNCDGLSYFDLHTIKFDESCVDHISENIKVVLKVTPISRINKIVIPEIVEKHKEIKQIKREAFSGAEIVLIASSTGGPVALELVIGMLPKDFSKPLLIVQHMPPGFTAGLAKTIGRISGMQVVEGEVGTEIVEGKVIIAPGGFHMAISQNKIGMKKIELFDTDHVNGVKPSADVLFKSVAQAYEDKRVLVVVLTGMGQDGSEGIKELKKRCNCYCITQTISTCVAYGMPKAVQDKGLSDKEVDIKLIAGEIYRITREN